jgi:hypothetical protein
MINQEPNLSDIEKLSELKEKGLLTQQEFEEKKNRILNSTNPPINNANSKPTNKKSSGCLKIGAFVFIGFFALAFFYFIGSNISKSSSKNNSISKTSETENKTDKNEFEQISNVINSIKSDKDNYKDENWQMYLVTFKASSKLIKDNESIQNDSVQNKLKELKKVIGEYQSKLLPKMRNSYAKTAKDKLWRSNIDVSILGNRNTTLQFTGGSLASNANKEDFMKAMDETVNDLRFKKINMKWFKYDDEYTYYTLKTKQDSDIYD